ncbi:MAG TPA: hypothetical protein VI455_05885 [Terriglobia bacterium]
MWRLDRCGRSVTDLLATLQEREHLRVGLPQTIAPCWPVGHLRGFERENLGTPQERESYIR